MSNHLISETSPYLLQHAHNPVHWHPWGEQAFARAKEEDKPVFLSIGYSTCHWCHVMAHESFEDEKVAALLNEHFIAIKVDKEERPDIDSVYMAVCQAFTGSGGWPMSIFLTPSQEPFFAGTYFPKTTRDGHIGLMELLSLIQEKWKSNRGALLTQAQQVIAHLQKQDTVEKREASPLLLNEAAAQYHANYDAKYGGFGHAPKFPTPHNLLFLLTYYERCGNAQSLQMAGHTLLQMYKGGLFDHIGYGFCRYSTDERFLVPHFEKMLYDNALLILAYVKAHAVTKKPPHLSIAEKTAAYVLQEMADPQGGFYSAQDADSEGEEGKFYLFTPDEIISVLGEEDGALFNAHYGITQEGNFEGKNIAHLLGEDPRSADTFEAMLEKVREYRKNRFPLHTDDKILTAWNGLMIAALCALYRASNKEMYLHAAQKADRFIEANLCSGDTLYVSYRAGKRGVCGFLDDYACMIFAKLALYEATLEENYLSHAKELCQKVLRDFSADDGGFYLYEAQSEPLILRSKETYDGAMPSGNSLMAWNLVRLSQITQESKYEQAAKQQLDFLAAEAKKAPMGHAMFLLALLDYCEPPQKITIVPGEELDPHKLTQVLPLNSVLYMQQHPTKEYARKENKTTFYVCRDHTCFPPVNDLRELE